MKPLRRLRPVPDPPDVPLDRDRRAAALMARAADGDQGAFAELYDLLAGLVHGIVLRVLRDPAQSEEVTQEVMVDLWRHAPRYDPASGSVRGWAATLAHRRAVDRVRSEQASRAREDRLGRMPEHDVDSTAEEVEDQLDRERVTRALESLTTLQRQTVELAYFGGHTYREVAALLDVPEGTVKTRIRDGLIRLRDTLGVVT